MSAAGPDEDIKTIGEVQFGVWDPKRIVSRVHIARARSLEVALRTAPSRAPRLAARMR